MTTKQKRIGFACKLSKYCNKKGIVSIPEYNTQTTTLAWLSRQSKSVAYKKLESIVHHNLTSINLLVQELSQWDPAIRMVRLSSEILPVYTHLDWKDFYNSSTIKNYLQSEFLTVGDIARKNQIRLSFHPGQFTVLASDRSDVVENSIREFEYHVDMMRWMGYGKTFQDFKINVHISGKCGVAGILSVLPRLSTEARNAITIENEEYSYGLDSTLELREHVALVLDLHHHWIKTGGYISSADARIARIQDSWRGVRPVIHYSVSGEDLLSEHDLHVKPYLQVLLENNYKKAALRAHSNFMWNTAVNSWVKEHWNWADIMVESKAKNLASVKLYKEIGECL